MEVFRSEFKYLGPKQKLAAYRYELKSGIDKEIVAAYMSGVETSLYYEELYAPLFVAGDTILIFDHYSDRLYRFDDQNVLIDSLSIAYHKGKNSKTWGNTLIMDIDNYGVYGLFNRNGFNYLQSVNTSSGVLEGAFKLTHRYSEHIQIRDDWAYYVYRPFESAQKKFLYRERISLD
jgi:hypothetical protein